MTRLTRGVSPLHSKDFQTHLDAWALLHGLKESTRVCCGHGVTGRGAQSELHEHWCVGWRGDLIDHATVWNRNGRRDRLLVAFTFRPGPDDLGYESYLVRVNTYADRLGIAAYVPRAAEPIHTLYATDTTAVLYGVRGLDLAPFAALPVGLSPDLDRRTARLAREQESKRKQMARERERVALRRAANPKPLSASARFRAEHSDEVRALYGVGDVTQAALAVRFGVSEGRINGAVRADQS